MDRRKLGAIQVALGAICWSFAGVFCKFLPWGPFTIVGLRALVCAIALTIARGGVRVHITRGTLLGAVGAGTTGVLFLCATKLTTAANAIVLQYAMPVVVIGLCWIFYHQKPSRLDTVTAAIVLVGVILCSWTGLTSGGGRMLGDLLAIASAFTFALVFFCARLPDANAQDYVYLGNLMSLPFVICAFFDSKMTLAPAHLASIVVMGLCLAGGYFFVSRSLNNVHPVTSALLANLEPVLNPLWVFLFLGERPGALTLIGSALVIVTVTVYAVIGSRRAAADAARRER